MLEEKSIRTFGDLRSYLATRPRRKEAFNMLRSLLDGDGVSTAIEFLERLSKKDEMLEVWVPYAAASINLNPPSLKDLYHNSDVLVWEAGRFHDNYIPFFNGFHFWSLAQEARGVVYTKDHYRRLLEDPQPVRDLHPMPEGVRSLESNDPLAFAAFPQVEYLRILTGWAGASDWELAFAMCGQPAHVSLETAFGARYLSLLSGCVTLESGLWTSSEGAVKTAAHTLHLKRGAVQTEIDAPYLKKIYLSRGSFSRGFLERCSFPLLEEVIFFEEDATGFQERVVFPSLERQEVRLTHLPLDTIE